MKKILLTTFALFLIVGMLVQIPLISAQGNSEQGNNAAIFADDEGNEIEVETEDGNKISINAAGENASLIRERIREAIQERNQFRFENKTGITCPEGCFCRGVVVSCDLDGGKQMSVYAQSGNKIVINSGGENMTTNVTLYHHDGRVFGVFDGEEENESKAKEIKVLPNEAYERAREGIRARVHNESLSLNEEGEYEYRLRKEARFLGIFKVRERMELRMDPETGEVLREKAPWWGFLANDIEETNSTE